MTPPASIAFWEPSRNGIAGDLKGKIIEIGMDATYNMNLKHLELYSVMAEYDSTGFPLGYCLLTTELAICIKKHSKALATWICCLRNTYGLMSVFTHVNKDMAGVGSLKEVWSNKISLCWWHLQQAVQTHMKNAKLSTTPYNVKHACAEFPFIDIGFVVIGHKPDHTEYEGGVLLDDVSGTQAPTQTVVTKQGLHIRIPAQPDPKSAMEMLNQSTLPKITIQIPILKKVSKAHDSAETANSNEEAESEDNNNKRSLSKHTFCKAIY
ncbi:hypothetical protein BDQ17DRAFT_1425633 [Cyathus striatus]|nr:hypothetical protein BDQ17DRAFT_1425633 [Cyathus striatus]